ncbi:MAG: Bug family tripartite tricarboxylate transporter substrate binding protein, partial [Pseudomonadota bacterium]
MRNGPIRKCLLVPGLCALISAAILAGAAFADSVADFYSHKTLTLIVGFPPGGGYDANARVLARHFGRFIPGRPTV